MLGKFLGKEQKSALPKNQIEVVCPVCGAAQIEPRLVVTTHCRKCREHLRIVDGKVLASSHMNPVPSAVFPAMLDSHPVAGATKAAADSSTDAEENQLPAALLPPKDVDAEDIPLGLGHMMGFKDVDDTGPRVPKNPIRPKSNLPPRPTESAATPQPPMSAGTLQKMKEQGYYRQQYFKDVECFDCRNKFKTGRSARTTHCPACGSLISLEDVDINLPSTTSIRTRGDVLIRKNGNVNTSEVRCRDLKVQGGQICAEIECSGDLQLKTTGIIIGEIHCRRFLVERGSDIRFLNTIFAEDVDVQARIEGTIECTGRVTIGAMGCVQGDVTARSVSIEPGGQLNGAMNILRASAAKPARPVASGSASGGAGGIGSGGGTPYTSGGFSSFMEAQRNNGSGGGGGGGASPSSKDTPNQPQLPI